MTSVYNSSYQKLLKGLYEKYYDTVLPTKCLIIDKYGKTDIRDFEVLTDPWQIKLFLEML